MRKPYPYTELSEQVCIVPGCRTRLKRSLVERKPSARKCYAHHCEQIGLDPRSRKVNRENHNRRVERRTDGD